MTAASGLCLNMKTKRLKSVVSDEECSKKCDNEVRCT